MADGSVLENEGTRYFDRLLSILSGLHNRPGVMEDPDIRASITMRPEEDLEGCNLIWGRIKAKYGLTEGTVGLTSLQSILGRK